jgi:ribokinase
VLTGAGTPQEAAEMIGTRVPIVVVSLGAEGAAACIDGRAVEVSGYDVGPSVDTTGAGDLFVAAWAWGDAVGLGVDDALKWAALYAGLSVRVPTGAGGATRLGEFMEEGARRGLPAPPPRSERVA